MAARHGGSRPVALILIAVWVGFVAPEPVGADPVGELLDQLEKRREQVKTLYHATKTVSREGEFVDETNAQVWERRDGKTCKVRRLAKMKASRKDNQPPTERESLTVMDGRHEWRQMPVGEQVMVIKTAASEYRALEDVCTLARSGKPRIKGHESIRREPCVVLEVTAPGKNTQFRATYWISETYGVVLKSAVTRVEGSTAETDTIDFRVNEPVGDDKFVYEPPEGATVLDMGASEMPLGSVKHTNEGQP